MKKSIKVAQLAYIYNNQRIINQKFLSIIFIFLTIGLLNARAQDLKLQFQENLSFNVKGMKLNPNGRELLIYSEFDLLNFHIPTRKILFKRGIKGKRIHSADFFGQNIYIETGYYDSDNYEPDSVYLINKLKGEVVNSMASPYRLTIAKRIDKNENWISPFWSIYSEKFYNNNSNKFSACSHIEIGFSRNWNNWKSQVLKVEDNSCILDYRVHPSQDYLALMNNQGKIYVLDSNLKVILETEKIGFSATTLLFEFIGDEIIYFYEDFEKGKILVSYNFVNGKRNYSHKIKIEEKYIPSYKLNLDIKNKQIIYSDYDGCSTISLATGEVKLIRRTNSVNGPMVFDSERNGVFIYDAYKSKRNLFFIQLDYLHLNNDLIYPKVEHPYDNISFNSEGKLVLDFIDVKIFGSDFLKPDYFRLPNSPYNLVGVDYRSTVYDKNSELFFSVEGNKIDNFDVDTLFIRSYDRFGKTKEYFSLKVKKSEFNDFQFFEAYLSDPKMIVLRDNRFNLFFYNLKGKLIKKLNVNDKISSINYVFFSPKGNYFSYVNDKNEVEIVSVPNFKTIHKSNTNSTFNFKLNFFDEESAIILHNEGMDNVGSNIYFVELEDGSSENNKLNYYLNDVSFNKKSNRLLMTALNGDSSILISTSLDDKSSNIYQFPGYVSKIICSPISEHFITVNSDGSFLLWKEGQQKWLLKYFENLNGDFGWVSPDSYYSSSSGIGDAAYISLYDYICDYNFIDPVLNRPDIIQSRWLFSNPEKENLLKESVRKRSKIKFGDANFIEQLNPIKLNNYAIRSKAFLTHNLPVVTKDSILKITWDIEDTFKQFKPVFKIYQNNIFVKQIDKFSTQLNLLNGINSIRIETEFQGKRLIPLNFKIDADLEYKPNIIYVGIGVSKYKDSSYNLPYAAKDIMNLAGIFNCQNNPDECNQWDYLNKSISRIGQYYQTQEQIDSATNAEKHMDDSMQYYFNLKNKLSFNINKINVYTLLNEEVTKDNIKKLEKKIKSNSDPRDIIIIHFAGHGMLDSENDFFLAGYDMDFSKPNKHGIPYSQIDDFLKKGPLNRLVFIDACQSGLIDPDFKREIDKVSDTFRISKAWSRGGLLLDEPDMVFETAFEIMQNHFQVLDMETGASVMAATAGNALAYESPIWNNGVFTFCIIRGLFMSEADSDEDGKITISELKSFLQAEVPKLTQGLQKPAMRAENTENNFVVW